MKTHNFIGKLFGEPQPFYRPARLSPRELIVIALIAGCCMFALVLAIEAWVKPAP